MSFYDFMFWVSAVTAVGGGAMVLLSPGIVHMAFWLLASLAGFAALYLHLGADFLGFVQVLVYIGGVLILFLFGVMLTRRQDVAIREKSTWRFLVPGCVAGAISIVFLLWLVQSTPWVEVDPGPADPTSAVIGERFMSTYILPFEAVSVLLLVAMIGATYLSRGRDEVPASGKMPEPGEEGGRS